MLNIEIMKPATDEGEDIINFYAFRFNYYKINESMVLLWITDIKT